MAVDSPLPADSFYGSSSAAPSRAPSEGGAPGERVNGEFGQEHNQLGTNWELIFVYSFLVKFTPLRDLSSSSTLLFSPMSLEQALLDCSPPPGSRTIQRDEIDLSLLPAIPKFGEDGSEAITREGTVEKAEETVKAQEGLAGDITAVKAETTEATDADAALLSVEDSKPKLEEEAELNPDPAAIPSLPELPPLPDLTPSSNELMVQVLSAIHAVSPGVQAHEIKKVGGWFPHLVKFIQACLGEQFRRGLSWRRNWLRQVGVRLGYEDEGMWWRLEWEEKVHLLRVWIDWCLCYSPAIRAQVDEGYDLGKQRVSKRRPYNNRLVIEPHGTTMNGLEVWSLDNSVRLYGREPSSNAWHVIASTKHSFVAYKDSLLDKVSPKLVQGNGKTGAELKGPFKLAKEAADKAKTVKPAPAPAAPVVEGEEKKEGEGAEGEKKVRKPGGRRANRYQVLEGDEEKEVELRKALDAHLVLIQEGEDVIEALRQKQIRAQERAAERDAKLARQLAGVPSSIATRGDRLRRRTQMVNYVMDDDELEEQSVEYEGRSSKRRRTEAEQDWSAEVDEEDEEDQGARRGRGGPRKSYKEVVPGVDDELADEAEYVEDKAAASTEGSLEEVEGETGVTTPNGEDGEYKEEEDGDVKME